MWRGHTSPTPKRGWHLYVIREIRKTFVVQKCFGGISFNTVPVHGDDLQDWVLALAYLKWDQSLTEAGTLIGTGLVCLT
jgi:hypothetical protein